MNKIKNNLIVLAAAASLASCNDKLNIAAPYKDITVVYGLLNKADTAHYIRIQKAFMDENKSAIDMAQEADSSFYRNLIVVVKEISASGAVLNTFPLQKVDLTAEGYPKEAGDFFQAPNYAYKFKQALTSDNEYRVVITNTETGNVDSASTPIIENSDVSKFTILEWLSGFAGALPKEITFPKLTSPSGKLLESTFSSNIPDNVGAVELVMRFNWTDSNVITNKATRRFADFNGFYGASGNSYLAGSKNFTFTTQNKSYFDFLKSAMGKPDDLNTYRYMDSVDMFLYAAGTEYKKYQDLNSNKGGLTANEIKPMYTNIKGKEVMGLFSTKGSVQKLQIPIHQETRDSLLSNSITKELNIRF